MKIDKIYVLAINHTQEKIDDIVSRLESTGFEPNTPFVILKGHNAYTDKTPEGVGVYEKWGIANSWNKFWQMPVQTGEVGCALSHINAWKTITNEGVERALILEEDFQPVNGMQFKDIPETNIPLVCVPSSFNEITADELASAGFDVVIYANHLMRASYKAMHETAMGILKNDCSVKVEDKLISIKEILKLIPGTE